MHTEGDFGDKPGGFDREKDAVSAGRDLLLYRISPDHVPTVVIIDTEFTELAPWVKETGIWEYVGANYEQSEIIGKYRILR